MKRENILKLSTSNLQCYCDDLEYKIGGKDASQKEFEVSGRSETYRGKMCQDYLLAKFYIYWSVLVIPGILELTNFLIKRGSKFAVKFIKFENKTLQESGILLLDYFLTLFNSSILILIINGNFSGVGIQAGFVDGFYGDFSSGWYSHVAPIFITPMIIRCVVLPIPILWKWLLRKIKILFDKRGLLFGK